MSTEEPQGAADTPRGSDDASGSAVASTSPRSRRRGARLARRAGAGVAALALLGATAAVVLADEADPAPPPRTVPAPAVGVPATPHTAICGGPPQLAAGQGMSVDPELEPGDVEPTTLVRAVTAPRQSADAAAATYGPLGQEPTALTATGQVRVHEGEVTEPGVLRAEPVDGAPALAAGASLSRTAAGDLRGLLSTPCLSPTTTTWLVGGSTEPGASAQLLLSNLGQTPATVDVTGWGSLGELGGETGILVPPTSQRLVLLEAAVGSDPRPAVRVTASGGQVAATVQTHQMNGLVPAGVDTLTPAAAPAPEVTVPGVVLTEESAGSAVRVLNPGPEPATVAVSLLGSGGQQELAGAEDVVVDPGAVVDVSLEGVEPGAYAVHLSADVPVTAGAVVTRTGQAGELDPDTAPVDRAWSAAAPPLPAGMLTVPGDLADTATVALSNPSDHTLTVWLRAVSGEQETMVEVPARSAARLDVADLGEDVRAIQVAVSQNGVVAPEDAAGEGTGSGEGTGDGSATGGTGSSTDDGAAGTPDDAAGPPQAVVAALVLTAQGEDGELITVLPATEDPEEAGEVRVDLR